MIIDYMINYAQKYKIKNNYPNVLILKEVLKEVYIKKLSH